MQTVETEVLSRRQIPLAVGRMLLWALWTAIRFPILTVLVILEPFVATILMCVATLGVLMCLFNGVLLKDPHFHLWMALCLSIGSGLLLLPYYALIRVLATRYP